MKYNKIIYLVAAMLTLACTENFEDINKNPYEASKNEMERGGYLIGASLIGMQGMVIPTQEHLHQFQEMLCGGEFSGYFTSPNTWAEKFGTYNPPAHWNRAPFNDVISRVYPYYDQIQAATNDSAALSLALLFRVAAMHRVTDAYGPIPYSKVGKRGSDDSGGTTLASAYDSQEEVYTNMLADLDEVIRVLTENRDVDPAAYRNFDNVYDGVMQRWVKYANSLKLRMAIRMAYVNPQLAQQIAEEAINHEIGVITDNADNAFLKVERNPLEIQAVQWSDTRVAADIISYMNGYNDPRRAAYFTLSTFLDHETEYVGLRSGVDNANKDAATPASMPVVTPTSSLLWMNAAEVAFLKAEGALRGWNMGKTAETLYKEGVTLSFGQLGASGVEEYLEDATSAPVAFTDPLGVSANGFAPQSSIKVKWNNSSNFETHLEQIITQKWIAIYPLTNEAWAEFRRTGYPQLAPVVLNKSGGAIANGKFVRRLFYPDTEYQENAGNMREAVQLLGGPDNGGTKLWWDKK